MCALIDSQPNPKIGLASPGSHGHQSPVIALYMTLNTNNASHIPATTDMALTTGVPGDPETNVFAGSHSV